MLSFFPTQSCVYMHTILLHCTLSQQDYKVYTMLFNIPRRFLLSPTLIDTPRSSFIHLVPPSASNTPSLMFSPLFRSFFHSNILTTSTLHLHTRNSRKTAHIFLLQNYRSPERSRPQDSLLSSHPRNDPWPASQTTDDWNYDYGTDTHGCTTRAFFFL